MLIVVALIPPITALLLLLVWKLCSRDVGWLLLLVVVTLVSLVPAFHQTPGQILACLGEGARDLLTIGVVLLPAFLFYQMQQETGATDILLNGLGRFVPDRDLQTLLLVIGVGPCIECLCGSGTGALVILPLLVQIQNNKLKAVLLSLLSQILAAWGNLGQLTAHAANMANVPAETLSIYMALLLFPSTIGFSILALQLSGGKQALERHWCIAPLAGGLLMFVTCLCSKFFLLEVSGFLASLSVIVLLLAWGFLILPPAANPPDTTGRSQFAPALFPFLLLTTGLFATHLLPSIHTWVQTHGVLDYSTINLHLALLDSPGLWFFLGALVHIPLFSVRRLHLQRIHMKTWHRFFPAVIAIGGFLATSVLMENSGMIDVLGSAAAVLSDTHHWIAPLFGSAGGWFTQARLGENALTEPMQTNGVPLPWVIAAQNAELSMAVAVSPVRIVFLAAAVGLLGKEALLWRKIGPIILWSLLLTILLLLWFTSALWMVLLLVLVAVNAPILSNVIAHRRVGETPLRRVVTQEFSIPQASLPIRLLAYGGLLLVNVLYASFSLVSLGPLNRIDPLIFLCFQMGLLAPIGGLLLVTARKHFCREVFFQGIQLGGFLSIGLLCFTLSLKDTGITETMVFSTINGIIATLIAWKVFGQRISTLTKYACLFAFFGAGLVWYASPAKWQGNFTAFIGGVLLTGFSFGVERLLSDVRSRKRAVQPVLGVQFLTQASTTLVIALMFGRWQTVGLFLPSDLMALCYLSFATILLPSLIMLMAQRYISAVTVAFFSVLEPLSGVGFAFVYAGERLPALIYLGGGLVLVGIVLQVIGGTSKQEEIVADPSPLSNLPEASSA